MKGDEEKSFHFDKNSPKRLTRTSRVKNIQDMTSEALRVQTNVTRSFLLNLSSKIA